MDFKDQITQSLRKLSNKQLCQFSWLCGIRILPFLSFKMGFAYWSEYKRQDHLYSIFYALDITAQAAFADDLKGFANANVTAVARAANEAAKDAAYDARAAASAAAYTVAQAAAYAAATAAAASAKAAYAAAANAAYETFDLESFLLDDIKAINENRLDMCNHDTSIYGELWNDFQEDLKAIGCDYWTRFYENLFNNGFKIDKKLLERHVGVPNEIRDQGAAAVGRYLKRLGDKIEQLNEARIIILGEKGAGKTSLARKLRNINAEMPKEYESTEGVERHIWDFPDKDGAKKITAHIWDFAGHSITHSAHRCFMSARCLYIYVYNGRIERDNDPSYWLEQIRIHGGNSPVLFLINEKDGHNADIAEKTLKNEYPSIAGYYRVDIGDKENTTKLKEFRQTVMDMVRNNPSWNSQVVSVEAYKIKSKLREHFEETKSPHITRDEFNNIAKICGAQDEHEGILKDLHTLGICLWYNEEDMKDFNMLVLNPDWITNGIYRIINKGFKEHEHILTVQKGTEILKDDKRYKYSTDNVAYLFRLMRVYELAFFKDKSTDNIFIPGILPIDMPDKLSISDYTSDCLTMSFVVEKALPPDIVTRIIVQRNELGEIFNEDLLWRKGAVLKYQNGDAIALVIEDARSVTVRVKGADRTPYIASLRETVKGIFESYQVIKPDLKYEVLIPEEAKASDSMRISGERQEPLMLTEDIINVYSKRQMLYLDPVTERLFSLLETVLAYRVNNITNNYYAPVNIELNNCVVKLNDLARDLRNEMFADDADYVEEVATAVGKLQEVINTIPNETEVIEKIKEKRWFTKIKGFFGELFNENSDLYKNTVKLRNGAKRIQSALRVYNDFVKIIPGLKAILPEIPDGILNIGKK